MNQSTIIINRRRRSCKGSTTATNNSNKHQNTNNNSHIISCQQEELQQQKQQQHLVSTETKMTTLNKFDDHFYKTNKTPYSIWNYMKNEYFIDSISPTTPSNSAKKNITQYYRSKFILLPQQRHTIVYSTRTKTTKSLLIHSIISVMLLLYILYDVNHHHQQYHIQQHTGLWLFTTITAFTTTNPYTSTLSSTTSNVYSYNNQNSNNILLQRRIHNRYPTSLIVQHLSSDDTTSSTSSTSSSSIDNNNNSGTTMNDEIEWKAVLAAFQMYKAAYGDLKVPQRFVVPNIAPWPKNAWGLKLGKVVSAIRLTGRYISSNNSINNNDQQQQQQTNQERKKILDQMGFVWSVRRSPNDDESIDMIDDSTTNGIDRSKASSTTSTTITKPSATSGIRLEQIMMATELYKTIVGKTVDTIPDNYVVPDTDTWPESVRGLPLGRQLEIIKRSKNENIRNKFAALGVPMEPLNDNNTNKTNNNNSISDNNKRDEGNVNTQSNGASNMQSNDDTTSKPSQQQSDIALALEMAWDGYPDGPSANDVRFQNVYTALVTYMKLYDDLLVPQPFVVPNNDPLWPQEIWGLRLGARVNAIRSQGTFVNNNPKRRQLLDDIGFVWNPPKERRRGRKVKDDMVDTMSNMNDESNYDNTQDDEDGTSNNTNDPNDMNILFDGTFDFGKDFDMSLGVGDTSKTSSTSLTWNLDGARMPETSNTISPSIDPNDANEYKPPRSWAESLQEATERALDVGIIEGLTPTKRVIKGKREKNIPWFNDDFGNDFVFEDVVEALTIYKSIYGDFTSLTMESEFIIPAAKEVTGFLDMDNMETFDIDASTRAATAIAKFKEQGQVDRSTDLIAAEINRLRQVDDDVSSESNKRQNAVLDGEMYADRWPEHLAGMTLGSIVNRIRDGSLEVKHLPDRKEQLDAIEFDWGDPKYFIDIPFEKAVCAMFAYYLVRGDLFVMEDFIMPDEDPWPQALAGYEIGKAVKRLRELQNFLEAYHPEKVGLLRMIDFVWFADTMALPLDSNEKEMDSETLLLCAMGHPDYAKMIDIPMGLPDKIVADGPFYETDDDPKLWWRKWHNWEYVKDYWYEQGRRDNAYVLRGMGYPRMADEHEARYGPGLFTQIDKLMSDLDNGSLSGMNPEEKKDTLEKLNYYRQEMLGCTDIHPRDRDALLSELDTQMLLIMKSASMDISIADELDSKIYEANELSMDNGVERKRTVINRLLSNDDTFSNAEEDELVDDNEQLDDRIGNDDEDDEDRLISEEEFDVEDELGLAGDEW